MMFDVTTIGSATRDIFFITDKGDVFGDPEDSHRTLIAFEFGDKVEIENVHITDGGGGCNSSTALARLGFKTKSLIRVGADESGEVVKKQFEKEGVDTSGISFDEKLRTGISAIIIDKISGERTVLFYPGANLNMKIEDRKDIIENTKWLYIAPFSADRSIKDLPDLCREASEKGVKISFNPSMKHLSQGYQSMKSILECSNVLIVNKHEAEKLVTSYLGKEMELKALKLMFYLQKLGPEICVLTLGSQGSMAISNHVIYKQNSIQGKSIDTTGAGDSFGSTFVAGQILGSSIEDSLKMASINATSVISKYGAQEGLLKIVQLKRIFDTAA